MNALRVFLNRLTTLLRCRQADREFDDEIASHLAEAAAEYIARGLAPEDARLAAMRDFGGITQTKQIHREVRSFTWPDNVRQDLKYTFRRLVTIFASYVPARRATSIDPFVALRYE